MGNRALIFGKLVEFGYKNHFSITIRDNDEDKRVNDTVSITFRLDTFHYRIYLPNAELETIELEAVDYYVNGIISMVNESFKRIKEEV